MNLTIAVLTGHRPHLLYRTLTAFTRHHRDIWDQAERVVLHNGGDLETSLVLNQYRWDTRAETPTLLPIGEATHHLNLMATRYVTLRLEDDWEAQPGDLAGAVNLLTFLDVDQVRLRAVDDPVSSRCAVCREPTRWTPEAGGHRFGHAHWTYNPTLTRTKDLVAGTEREAMRATHPAVVAQHVPGLFRHIGTDSLRATRGAA